MKLLFVIQGLHSGGAERVMSVLCNTFCKQNIQVILALTEQNTDFAYTLENAVKIVDLTKREGSGLVRGRIENITKLRALYKKEKPDAVVSFITRTNICAIFAGIGMKIPVIISERNNPVVDPKSRKTRMLRNMLYPLAAGCVFQTNFAMDCFSERIKRKSTVIFNPVSTDIYTGISQKREKKIVSICRLNQQKNIPLLINAFAEISEKHPEYVLEIFGEGEEKENLERLIMKQGLDKKCRLMGYTSAPIEVLEGAEIFALSSNYEGMPNALIEAMCAGCACVATDSPAYGGRDLIENNKNGILVEVGNVKAFSEALDLLMSDEKIRKRFGIHARNVESKVNTKIITKKWLDFIESKIK